MELRHLRYFVAVAEELNYRKASERLHVTQPALSSQIKDLESDVGEKLLDRNTTRVRLTDAGTIFLDEARAILARADQAIAVTRDAARGRRGRLAVGYFAPIFMGLMPQSLKEYREKFPAVDVALVEMPIVEQVAALQSGAIQIAFTVGESMPIPPQVASVTVARSPVMLVVHRDHRLARARNIGIADLVEERILCFSPTKRLVSVQGEIIKRAFANRGLKLKSLQQIDGVEAFRAMLESGMGVSLIAESGSLTNSEHLVVKPLQETGDDLMLELRALWRADDPSLLVDNFIAVMKGLTPRTGRARRK